MRPAKIWRLALAGLLGLQVSVTAASHEDLIFGVDDPKRDGKGDPTSADNAEALFLPYSQILRDTESPRESQYRDVRAAGRFTEGGGIGPVNVHIQGSLLGGRLFNFRPEDAELRLGRFYFDLRALSTSLLYSDNVNLSEDKRRDGVIGIVRLSAAALFEVSDSIQLGVQGTLVYLPFRSEVGIAGFGVYDPLAAFQLAPVFRTQLTLDQRVGNWDVEVFDEFSVQLQRFGADLGLNKFEQFDEEDRAGVYAYSDRSRYPNLLARHDYNEGRNLVGASASRLLPTVTRLEFGGDHANYFYYGIHDAHLPASRETVYAELVSERETLRFKPFVRYHAWNYDTSAGWSESVRGGIQGPITENLHLFADSGYYWRTDSNRESYLARLRLRHIFNPLTYQQLEYSRGITEPIEEIEDSVSYRVHHLFRADLSGELYGSIAKFENADTGGRTGEERLAATRFTYGLAQRTTLRLSGACVDFRNGAATGDYREWIGRGEIFYRNTTSLQTRLIYQYRNRHSDTPSDSYWENLVTLSVIKFF